MLCVCYGQSEEQSFTGGADGRVYKWDKCNLAGAIEAHKGPVFALQPVEKVKYNIHCCDNGAQS